MSRLDRPMNSIDAPSLLADSRAVSMRVDVLLFVLGLPEIPRIRVLKSNTSMSQSIQRRTYLLFLNLYIIIEYGK
jgi:hypothetical protein